MYSSETPCSWLPPAELLLLLIAILCPSCGYKGDQFTLIKGHLYPATGTVQRDSHPIYLGYSTRYFFNGNTWIDIIDTLYTNTSGDFELGFITDKGKRLQYWVPGYEGNTCYYIGDIAEGVINKIEATVNFAAPLIALSLQDSILSRNWSLSRITIRDTMNCSLQSPASSFDAHQLPGKQNVYYLSVIPDRQYLLRLLIYENNKAIFDRQTILDVGRDTVRLDW